LDQASSDPEDVAFATSMELSRRLVRGICRIWDARGITDVFTNRLPGNLADALVVEFGSEEALAWAHRIVSWAGAAIRELEGS
jgi:hypothetical protein